jgi:hypothetical protein
MFLCLNFQGKKCIFDSTSHWIVEVLRQNLLQDSKTDVELLADTKKVLHAGSHSVNVRIC